MSRAPRDLARDLDTRAAIPPGRWERLRGHAVAGVPFASGHLLALRHLPATSLGPEYRSVWHRDPAAG